MRGAVVLSGGASQRLRRDKGLALLQGKPLVTWVSEAATRVAGEVVVVVSRRQNRHSYVQVLPEGVKVVCDELDLQSPLVGMLTGFSTIRSEYVSVVSCDQPFTSPQVLEYLFRVAEGFDCAVPRWPDGKAEFLQAVYRVCPAKLAAQRALAEGELRSLAVVKRLAKVQYVKTDELRRFDRSLVTFFNVNTQEDLLKAEKLFRTAP